MKKNTVGGRTKKHEAKYCAPSKSEKNGKTCYKKTTLTKIAKILNKEYSKTNTIGGGEHILVTFKKIKIKGSSKMKLWEQIQDVMSDKCDTEWCWIDNEFIKNGLDKDEINSIFRPIKPKKWEKNKNTWLTTTDIVKVMKQYENQHDDFVFFGPVPVDCPNGIYCELTNLDIALMHKVNLRKIGIIFNLDRHDQDGSHWVALFMKIDKKKCNISYYDSYGDEPPQEINDFMIEICKKAHQMKVENIEMKYNKKRNQFGHSECGVFSMMFLIHSLTGKSLEEIGKHESMTDSIMNELRNYLYRPTIL